MDGWLTLEDHLHGKKVAVRGRMQERKKMYDFEGPWLWEEASGPHGE